MVQAPLGRKTPWTTVAFFYKDNWVPIYSARANLLAQAYLLPLYQPGQNFQSEVTVKLGGHSSRYDFGLWGEETGYPNWDLLTEIKACTLEHKGLAMFPDAPSARAARHTEGLALSPGRSQILFTIFCPNSTAFLPHPHTDPILAQLLLRHRKRIEIRTPVFKTLVSGQVELLKEVPIRWEVFENFDWDEVFYPALLEGTQGVFCGWFASEVEKKRAGSRTKEGLKVSSWPIRGRPGLQKLWEDAWNRTFVQGQGWLKIEAIPQLKGLKMPQGKWFFSALQNPRHQREFWDLLLDFRHGVCFEG